MIDEYRETHSYTQPAETMLAFCRDAVREIGAEVERCDAPAGIVHADFYPREGDVLAGKIHLTILVEAGGAGRSRVTVQAYAVHPAHSRWRPAGKPREIAGRLLSRIGDAVGRAEALAMDGAIAIETPRLILRTLTMADVAAVAGSWKLDEGPISPEEARDKIAQMQARHAQNRPGQLVHLCLAIFRKNTQELIGWCGLDHLDPADADPALFYLLKAAHWGQGLATEAAGALLRYALTELGLASIHGGAAPENLASRRVMEKIGMRFVGRNADGGYAFTITS